MKQLLLIFLLILTVNCLVFAQDNDEKIIGHHGKEYFVLKEDGYYLVEQLLPLMYNDIQYDTLFPVSNTIDTFRGKIYYLLLKNDKLKFVNRKYKCEVMKLKAIDDEAIKNRNRKHNFFYHKPYEVKISQYARFLSEKNKDKYAIFSKDRMEMYKKSKVLSIEDFKNYFDTFLKEYNIE